MPAAVTGAEGLNGGAVEVTKPVVPETLTVPLPGAVVDGPMLETEGSDDADAEDDETATGLVEVAVKDDTPTADDLVIDDDEDDTTAMDDTAEVDDTVDVEDSANEDSAVETVEEVSGTAVLDAEDEGVRTSEEDERTDAAEDEIATDSEEETGG